MASTVETSSLVWTPDELKETYLFGVKLSDDNGIAYPNLMFETWIASAQKQLERELDLLFTPQTVVGERHAFVPADFQSFGLVHTFHSPLIEVSRVTLRMPGLILYDFPREWISYEVPDADVGGFGSNRVQLVPAAGSVAQLLAAQGFNLFRWSGQIIPEGVEIDYRHGLRKVPMDIRHAVGLLASCDILNVAGDMIAGAGVASRSMSFGGMSSSVSTTASATNAGYGSRIIQYQKQLKEMLPRIKAQYQRTIRMAVA